MRDLEAVARHHARGYHAPCKISCRKSDRPSHPLARRPVVLRGAEADDVIRRCRVPDTPGARLNATLLLGRIPVIMMENPPLKPSQLRALNKRYFGKVGWRECPYELGNCVVYDSVLVAYQKSGHYWLHCLSLSHKQFQEVAFSTEASQSCIDGILNSMGFIIGGTSSSLQDGKKYRGNLKSMEQQGQQVKGRMAMEGWVVPFLVRRDMAHSFAYYALKQGRVPDEFMPQCSRHAVAMNALERLYCKGANDARWEQTKHLGGIYPNLGKMGAGTGFTGTAEYACEWHLDSSTRGTFETILFGKPPRLPAGHRWIFGLLDAGVLIDLHNSPTFLMIPGQDVLHGTMFTGKADGSDHVEHGAGGSALMNKRKITSPTAQAYGKLHLAKERRSI